MNTVQLLGTNRERTLPSSANRPDSPDFHRRIFRGAVRAESRQQSTCYGTGGTLYMAAGALMDMTGACSVGMRERLAPFPPQSRGWRRAQD